MPSANSTQRDTRPHRIKINKPADPPIQAKALHGSAITRGLDSPGCSLWESADEPDSRAGHPGQVANACSAGVPIVRNMTPPNSCEA